MAWVSLAKGVDLSAATVGLPDDLCPCPHWGYMIKGRVRMKEKGGSRASTPPARPSIGPPGTPRKHSKIPSTLTSSPTADFERVIAHISGGG